jgi:outer membrane protein
MMNRRESPIAMGVRFQQIPLERIGDNRLLESKRERRAMKRAFFVIGISVCILGASLPVKAADILTLEESIEIALERSLAALSADEEIRATEYEERSAKADFYPKLSTGYSYTRLDDETVDEANRRFPLGFTATRRDTYTFNLTATQPVFTGWALTTTRDLASLGVDIAKIQKETTVQDLVLNVKEAYFGILKAQKLETVAKQAVEQLEAQLKVSQAFYDEGIIAKNDLLQTEVQMAQARQDLITATNGIALAQSLFNKLLRREINEEVRIKDILDYNPIRLTLAEALEEALLKRPEINEVALNVQSAERSVDLSKSNYYPTVTLIGNYQRETDDVLLESIPGEDPDRWTVTLQGEWTFWEWGKTRHEVTAARARLQKAKYVLDGVKDNIKLEVKEAYLSLREAEKNIQVAKTAVVQAEENFRMNEERYKQQVATSTDVLDAQTLLTQARTNYFNALSDHNIAWARLERAMGMEYERAED